MTHEKESPQVGTSGHIQKIYIHPSKAALIAQDKTRNPVIEIVAYDPLTGAILHESRTRGKVARSLLYLHHLHPYGLTRIESLRRWDVLCLTQHVSSLRHTHKLTIDAPREAYHSVDGIAHVARYHLQSPVRLFLIGGAS